MADSKIKILIVSRTPWNEANSFGNTFTNLFKGMVNVELANICCQGGIMNNQLIEEAFQLTDKNVAKSIFGYQPGQIIKNGVQYIESSKPNVPRKTIFYVLREAIWIAGRWKSKGLKNFIKKFQPDILYLPIYRSYYMCKVDEYVIKQTRVPYVIHISDDVYSYSPKISFLDRLIQRFIRKVIKRIVQNANYGEVFSSQMAAEYTKIFNIPFYIIGKSVDVTKLPEIPQNENREVTIFVYTGNYGGERGVQLVTLAKCINETFHKGKAVLEIYSATKADDDVESQLMNINCVQLKGSVSSDKILEVQQYADYLIHVEGFTPEAIYESRLSFSTKIVDYLIAGRPIVAIGPQEVTSIQVLKSHDMAYVATNIIQINEVISQIAHGNTDNNTKINNGREYLLNYRDSDKMKKDMFQRFSQVLMQ